ncbi:hypothetical protein BDF21DRAFT_469469 [Thamnidium elegans]|nr:hypothetical protein BDF21DRAFT_469469 [Thamnidium elegans]
MTAEEIIREDLTKNRSTDATRRRIGQIKGFLKSIIINAEIREQITEERLSELGSELNEQETRVCMLLYNSLAQMICYVAEGTLVLWKNARYRQLICRLAMQYRNLQHTIPTERTNNCQIDRNFSFSGTDNGIAKMTETVPLNLESFNYHLRLHNMYSPLADTQESTDDV